MFELQAQPKHDGGLQLGVQNGQPSTTQFTRATNDVAQRKDEAFMRQVFNINRHATNEKLSASTLISALKDVAAPLLVASGSRRGRSRWQNKSRKRRHCCTCCRRCPHLAAA